MIDSDIFAQLDDDGMRDCVVEALDHMREAAGGHGRFAIAMNEQHHHDPVGDDINTLELVEYKLVGRSAALLLVIREGAVPALPAAVSARASGEHIVLCVKGVDIILDATEAQELERQLQSIRGGDPSTQALPSAN